VLLVSGLGVIGCADKPTPAPGGGEASPSSPGVSAPATPATRAAPAATTTEATPTNRDRLHQPFAEAVRGPDNPPNDTDRPTDETISKKPTAPIFEQVEKTWDSVRFTSAAGKKISYTARVETNLGVLVMELYPDLAPNHVRNFIALARAGYYDQLFFERIRHEKTLDGMEQTDLVEAGCPRGNGSTVTGSIGYWLKEETTPKEKLTHEEGTVGACRAEEPDTAATRFYITLNKASFLDGNYSIFGKVVRGLDVLRRIGQTPVIEDEEGIPRPLTPITILKVTIQEQEGAAHK